MTHAGRLHCRMTSLCTILLVQPAFAQSADTPLPPAAIAIMTQMNKEVVAAKMKAVTALEKTLKDTTKKGDLAAAMAIKEAIDQLKSEVVVAGRTPAGPGEAAAIVGRWASHSARFDFLPDGSVKASTGISGKWQINGKTIEVKWNHGATYRLTATAEGLGGVQISEAGNESAIALTREK